MLDYRCTQCGASLSAKDGEKIAKCGVCGALFVLPNNFENKANIYRLANEARLAGNFDAAIRSYSKILKIDSAETEAHWGYLLSKFGIGLSLDDTILFHRVEPSSFINDPSFENMMKYCPREAKYYYEALSREIDSRHKMLLEIYRGAKNYDIYINCTAKQGSVDYLLACQAAKLCTDAGYSVFLPCLMPDSVSPRDYNLYEIAIAEKASAMLVTATAETDFSEPRFKAVWKRYYELRIGNAEKKLLSLYRGIDPAKGLPLELQSLQSIDCGGDFADGFISEINKMFGRKNRSADATQKLLSLLREADAALESGNYRLAGSLYSEAQKLDAEESRAYFGLVCCETENLTLPVLSESLDTNYTRALQFADGPAKARYAEAMESLMHDAVWNALTELTGGLKDTSKEESTKAAISRVYLYLKPSDPLLSQIETYKKRCELARREGQIKSVYKKRDAAVQHLFAEQTKAEKACAGIYKKSSEDLDPMRLGSIGAIAALVLFLISHFLMMISCEGLAYEGFLYTVSRILFVIGTFATFMALWQFVYMAVDFFDSTSGILDSPTASIIVSVIGTVIIYNLSKSHIRQYHLYIMAVPLVLFFFDRIILNVVEFVGSFTSARKNAAVKKVEEIDLQIERAYMSEMTELYKQYSFADVNSIVKYKAVHSSGFDLEAQRPKNNNPFGYLLCTVLVALALVFTTTFVFNAYYTSGWNNIKEISVSQYHVVGLKKNGRVVASGRNDNAQCNVGSWKNVKQVVTGAYFTAGLKENGEVLVASEKGNPITDARSWTDIVELSASEQHLVGLKSDGTVVAAGNNDTGALEVSEFKNVKIARGISAADGHFTIAVCHDGTVLATEGEFSGFNVSKVMSDYTGTGKLDVDNIYGDHLAMVITTKDGKCQGFGSNFIKNFFIC